MADPIPTSIEEDGEPDNAQPNGRCKDIVVFVIVALVLVALGIWWHSNWPTINM